VSDAPAAEGLDRIELHAVRDLWDAAPDGVRERLGLVQARAGGLTVVGIRALPGVAMLNRVMGVGHAPFDPEALSWAVGRLHGAGCVAQVPLRPDDPAGPDAGPWLRARGFREDYAWMKFAHRIATPPASPGPQVSICAAGEGDEFGAVVADGYGLHGPAAEWLAALPGRDGWTCAVGRDRDGRVLGAGALFVRDGAAWLGLAATRPEARGRGAQTALIRARVTLAREAGCATVVSETGERVPDRPAGSYRNLLRAGFVEAGLRPNLVAGAK
jgi:GNAT superfamily N-acetyltransferase